MHIMHIILFLVILSILVFVHELGHFLLAKWNGIRVDSFAIGFPPTLWQKKVGETTYKINLLLFGGYVSIHGEDPTEESLTGPDSGRSMANKSWWRQISVLIAGIVFNMLFAWMVLTIILWIGAPMSVRDAVLPIQDPHMTVLSVLPDSPAEEAGLKMGDQIESITLISSRAGGANDEVVVHHPDDTDATITAIRNADTVTMTVTSAHDEQSHDVTIIPATGILDDAEGKAIGITLDVVGIARANFFQGITHGFQQTVYMTGGMVRGLWDLVTGSLSVKYITGPVGLVGMVGQASSVGLVSVLMLMAIISINLAVINVIPFPALDGGRILFVIIEKIKGSRIPPAIGNTVNMIGFGLLMLLMLLITVKDVVHLF
jgi:regulator of sigma E protease